MDDRTLVDHRWKYFGILVFWYFGIRQEMSRWIRGTGTGFVIRRGEAVVLLSSMS